MDDHHNAAGRATEVVYHDPGRGLRIERSLAAAPGYVELLQRTVWGTRGALYSENDVPALLARVTAATYYSMWRDDRLIAGYMALARHGRAGGREYNLLCGS
jgi:hypothetical protein